MDVNETVVGEPGAMGGYFSVQLQLLHQCNLRCAHCYDVNHPQFAMPSTVELKRRLDNIFSFGATEGVVPDIHLSGGEPTVRPDLLEIVDYIFTEKGGDALLFSNGTRWTHSLARDLYIAGLRFVQISLEGPLEHTDRIRGAGVFEKATETLRMLKDIGFRLTVSLTITSQNYPVLFRFVEDMDPMGLHFHLREVFPLGAGENLLQIARDQRRELAEWVIAYEGESTVGLEDPIHCSVSPVYALERRGCVAGRNHFCVDVDGSVYPCRPLAHRVGHVNYLRAAWYSPDMVRLRRRELEGRCGRCDLRLHCGGCRVHGLLHGNLFGEDTRCFAEEQGLLRDEARLVKEWA
jgi:radical SAM protein with 4Fe4S-binding SPASM domain